ncbi:Putative sodium-dependent excitatory amino acid transporter glt [Seminavis robusta]|uniref:Amino acid transporter n=1 Tax=Seminavis robusta TaxID=568900 RepID=A0A9N8HMY6_9STRA|nr:Putative sodium-dependent excitatory amino acid transporter glt [Seminavis robusta]|eukprot:Sro941_g222670.1 Putative sodium-dependent excitatory amino acid transporter glt (568) ;mRNA; f:33510-35322
MNTGTDNRSSSSTSGCCGILGRYPIATLIAFASAGIATGIGLTFWEPEDVETKVNLIKWIGLVGDLFIRALKCLVLPLIFVSVTIAVLEMLAVGRAGSVGWKTRESLAALPGTKITGATESLHLLSFRMNFDMKTSKVGLYMTTTVIASIIGIFSIILFQGTFSQGEFQPPAPPTVELGCNNEGMYLTEALDGSISCAAHNGTNSQFYLEDITGSLVQSSSDDLEEKSMSDTLYEGVFTKIVTDNVFVSFAEANFAAVVFFSICFGVAVSQTSADDDVESNATLVVKLFKQLEKVFLKMIQWVIAVTPFAVFSLIAEAIGAQADIKEAFSNVGFLIVAFVVGICMHFLIVHVGLFYVVTRRNPFSYLKHLIPAQTMAFACASSAATVPVTLESVRSTGWVPDPIVRFVVPLGATVNMDGSAIYYPMACIWLAYLNGINPDAASYVLLVILGTLGSIGAAPVPYSSLVLIITAYNTVFNTTGTPEGISFLAAIDWLIGSLRTVTNVTGDAVVCGMIGHLCPLDEEETMETVIEASKVMTEPSHSGGPTGSDIGKDNNSVGEESEVYNS